MADTKTATEAPKTLPWPLSVLLSCLVGAIVAFAHLLAYRGDLSPGKSCTLSLCSTLSTSVHRWGPRGHTLMVDEKRNALVRPWRCIYGPGHALPFACMHAIWCHSMPFGHNVYSLRFCMSTYCRCQGVGWNILRKIHAYFLWVRTKTDSYGDGKKCSKVLDMFPIEPWGSLRIIGPLQPAMPCWGARLNGAPMQVPLDPAALCGSTSQCVIF